MRDGDYGQDDFPHSPLVVFYEVTRACDLACRHCRACAQFHPHPGQLNTEQSRRLIDQLTEFPKPPLLVLTGGDPLKRPDLFELIRWARSRRLKVAVTPSATPLVTPDALKRMKMTGVHRLAISLDGADARTHDGLRGVSGSFVRTLQIMAWTRQIGLAQQVNTTVTRRNANQIDALADLLSRQGIVLWSVFFLVPVGRGRAEQRISPQEYEEVFERLWHHAQVQPYAVKTTEAHHYRRFVLQRGGDPQAGFKRGAWRARGPLGVNDGKGVMFISHVGQIFPSGFLPRECGRYPRESVVEVYRHSKMFARLRDPDSFKGKCGVCEYRHVCGGSRARAWALTGDPYESEPDCTYLPPAWKEEAACSE